MFIIFFFGLDLPYLWALHAGFEQRHQKGLGEKKKVGAGLVWWTRAGGRGGGELCLLFFVTCV